MLRHSLFISTALIVTACAGTPQLAIAPELDLPDAYFSVPETAGPQDPDWVASLGDPALEDLVAEAMGANPGLAIARANLEAALASARAAGAPRLPSAEGTVSGTVRDIAVGSPEVYSAGIEITWQADVWGRISDAARAGTLSAEASAADLAGAQLSIAASVANNWFALAEARLQRELAERDVETRSRQLEIVERRFVRGIARSSDVRTARSALASSQAALATRRRAEAAASRTLQIALGRYPDSTLQAAGQLPELGVLPEPGTPEALISRRPDLIAAERRLAAAGYSADAARKALYPSLNLRGVVSGQSSGTSDLFSSANLVESLAASITAPLFRGGALRAERDRAAAAARAQAARYVETSLTALREVENALQSDAWLAERLEAQQTARDEAAAALELVERQYASGVGTIFELIDAQTRLIQAESQLITARRDRLDNRVALHLAIAGPFAAASAQ